MVALEEPSGRRCGFFGKCSEWGCAGVALQTPSGRLYGEREITILLATRERRAADAQAGFTGGFFVEELLCPYKPCAPDYAEGAVGSAPGGRLVGQRRRSCLLLEARRGVRGGRLPAGQVARVPVTNRGSRRPLRLSKHSARHDKLFTIGTGSRAAGAQRQAFREKKWDYLR